MHRYAAHPGEHVLQPALFTTLFPHLGHRKLQDFRWAFIVGLAAILVLCLAGLVLAAILAAALMMPVLYLVYFYEAQIYRDEPSRVFAYTFGAGLAAGLLIALATRIIYRPFQDVLNPLGHSAFSLGALMLIGLALPVLQEVGKALGPFVMPKRLAFPETVDGLVFGAAGGFGLSAGGALIGFGAALTSLPAHVSPGSWIYLLL